MKFTLLSLLALGAFAMAVGPADRAAAGEPMELSAEQLDEVTAGMVVFIHTIEHAREWVTENANNSPRIVFDAGVVLLDVSVAAANPTPPGLPPLSTSPQ